MFGRKEDKVEMRDNFDSERSELSSVLTIFRQERKKEFSVRPDSCRPLAVEPAEIST